jgi:hypothetical protein
MYEPINGYINTFDPIYAEIQKDCPENHHVQQENMCRRCEPSDHFGICDADHRHHLTVISRHWSTCSWHACTGATGAYDPTMASARV